jgi:hypothetical protein
MYLYINNTVKSNEWGFDLLRTSDGGNSFEVITRTGFDDKYNYGCPSFLSTEEGLYFGTCNPFYGGQLYLLSEEGETPTGIQTIADSQQSAADGQYFNLNGQRVIQPGKGLYIVNGRKVIK